MSVLYRPVVIQSAAQASAFPSGTFAVRWDTPWIGERRGPDENGHTWWESKNGIYDHDEMIGDTALVPIEADERAIPDAVGGPLTYFEAWVREP